MLEKFRANVLKTVSLRFYTYNYMYTYSLLIWTYSLQKRAYPQLAKGNLGGLCFNSRIRKDILKKEIKLHNKVQG